jgi:IS5 family transposase
MLYEKVFEERNKQLENKGLVIKQGSIVDASLIKSHYSASTTEARRDADAVWTVKYEKPHHGYKAHVSVDEGSELISKLEITPQRMYTIRGFSRSW